MPEYQKTPLTKKLHAVDSGVICKTEYTDAAYKRIAAEVRAIARKLHKARTADTKRAVIAALLWQAESIRRTLVAEQKCRLHEMSERPQ